MLKFLQFLPVGGPCLTPQFAQLRNFLFVIFSAMHDFGEILNRPGNRSQTLHSTNVLEHLRILQLGTIYETLKDNVSPTGWLNRPRGFTYLRAQGLAYHIRVRGSYWAAGLPWAAWPPWVGGPCLVWSTLSILKPFNLMPSQATLLLPYIPQLATISQGSFTGMLNADMDNDQVAMATALMSSLLSPVPSCSYLNSSS